MISENSVTYQYIAHAANSTATTPKALPEGAVAIVNEAGTKLTSASTTTKLRIAQKINGMVTFSPYFIPANCTIDETDYAADAQKVMFLGYEPTADTGELDAPTKSAAYTLRVILKHTQGIYNNTPTIITIPVFSAAGTQLDLANNLIKVWDKTMARQPRKFIQADRVVDGAGANDLGSAVDADRIKVVNGSTLVEYRDDTEAKDGVQVNAGDVLNIKNYAYIVTRGGDDDFEIDRPYTGASEDVTLGDGTNKAHAFRVTGAMDWGIRFEGVALENEKFDPVTMVPSLVDFDITFNRIEDKEFTTAEDTLISTTTAPTKGTGSYQDVAFMEVYTTMNEGQAQISAYPPTKYRKAADPSKDYHMITISGKHDEYITQATGQRPVSKFNIRLAVNDDLNASDWAEFKTVLGA